MYNYNTMIMNLDPVYKIRLAYTLGQSVLNLMIFVPSYFLDLGRDLDVPKLLLRSWLGHITKFLTRECHSIIVYNNLVQRI